MGWSPEARKAAAEARRRKSSGPNLKRSIAKVPPYSAARAALSHKTKAAEIMHKVMVDLQSGNLTDAEKKHLKQTIGSNVPHISARSGGVNEAHARALSTLRARSAGGRALDWNGALRELGNAGHVENLSSSSEAPHDTYYKLHQGKNSTDGLSPEEAKLGFKSKPTVGAKRARSLMEKILQFDDPSHPEIDIDKLVGRGFALQKIDRNDIESALQALYPDLQTHAALERFAGHLDSRNNTLMERMHKWAVERRPLAFRPGEVSHNFEINRLHSREMNRRR